MAYNHPFVEEFKRNDELGISRQLKRIVETANNCYYLTKESIDLLERQYLFEHRIKNLLSDQEKSTDEEIRAKIERKIEIL